MNKVERIIFLGFAFHRQNVDLVLPPVDTPGALWRGTEVYGTGYLMSARDIESIETRLARSKLDGRKINIEKLKCADLFKDYWRSLSLLPD